MECCFLIYGCPVILFLFFEMRCLLAEKLATFRAGCRGRPETICPAKAPVVVKDNEDAAALLVLRFSIDVQISLFVVLEKLNRALLQLDARLIFVSMFFGDLCSPLYQWPM